MPVLKEFFPDQLKNIDEEKLYAGINKVQPSLVRTEADEVTYHFHVMIRYELEKILIEGTLEAKDIPAYWNEQYYKYLGVRVPDDKRGCLQDVHWSHGSFGYFPTYSMGSFYAAQFYVKASDAVPSLEEDLKGGTTQPLLKWLKANIYQHGRMLTSEELCTAVCGKSLDIHHFLDYILAKYKKIYNF